VIFKVYIISSNSHSVLHMKLDAILINIPKLTKKVIKAMLNIVFS